MAVPGRRARPLAGIGAVPALLAILASALGCEFAAHGHLPQIESGRADALHKASDHESPIDPCPYCRPAPQGLPAMGRVGVDRGPELASAFPTVESLRPLPSRFADTRPARAPPCLRTA